MPGLNGNYIDLIILLVVGIYVYEGIKRGFWSVLADLGSFLGSLVLALRMYPFVSNFLMANFTLPYSFSNAIGFIVSAISIQMLLNAVIWRGLTLLPKKYWEARWTKFAAVFPSLIDSLILLSVGLTLIVSLPVSPKLKSDVVDSKIGGFLVERTNVLEVQLAEVFGGAIRESLNFLTIKPDSNESVSIPYKPKTLTVDEASEEAMLELVNRERAKVGAKPLKIDPTIVPVARAHSRDMWERGYFSHTNPDGESPFDRMQKGGVKFLAAGENLALAPSVDLAHQGLMNSPGHKRNILDPQFGRVGIGVIDGGVYGKMFTQNFAD